MIDIKTILLLCTTLSFLMSFLMWLVNRRAGNIQGPGFWILNNLFNGLGQGLFLLYLIKSNTVIIILSNLFSLLGICFFVAGLRAFKGKKILWNWIILFSMIMVIATFIFNNTLPAIGLRKFSFSFLMFIISILGILECFGIIQEDLRSAFRVNGIFFILIALALLIRAILVLAFPQPTEASSSFASEFLYFILIITQVGIAFSSMLLVNFRYSSDLSRTNETKSFLFSILAHDLRSPIHMMKRFLEFVEDPTLTIEEKRDLIADLKKTVLSTSTLTENMLDWALNESGSLKVELRNISAGSLVEKIHAFYLPLLQEKEIQFKVSIQRNLPIYADEKFLETMLRNLLSNAIKYTHIGGNIQLQLYQTGNMTVISILDSGIGMSEEKLNSLFGLHYISSVKGTKGETGSGLGLLICKSFSEKLNGKIEIMSQLGKGTRVELHLPSAGF